MQSHHFFLKATSLRLLVCMLTGCGSLALSFAADAPAPIGTRTGLALAGWSQWSPRTDLAMTGTARPSPDAPHAPLLTLRADRFEQVAQWRCLVSDIIAGKHYRFEVQHQAQDVVAEDTSVTAVLTWLRSPDEHAVIQRDYVTPTPVPNGWRLSARTMQAPTGARCVRIDLGLRWTRGGSVTWRNILFDSIEPPAPRTVRVATTRLRPHRPSPTVEDNTALMLRIFDEVGAAAPDIVLFPENYATQSVRGSVADHAQPIPGPLTAALAAKARQYRCYAIWTMLEAEGGRYHNTAVLVDRDGEIVARYRKVHLTMEETEQGITPGNEYPVFQVDFGRIGIVTCWDNWFGESARILRLQGAEILFFPLAGDSQPAHWEHVWRTRAIDNGVWLVSSVTVTKAPSRVISPDGEVLAETLAPFGHVVVDVPLDRETRERYMSVGDALGEPASLFVKERRPDTYNVMTTGSPPSSSIP
jgi:predicted amidohydrolase